MSKKYHLGQIDLLCAIFQEIEDQCPGIMLTPDEIALIIRCADAIKAMVESKDGE